MAWALQFDGVNDYVSFNSISLSGDFDLYIDVTLDVLLDAYHGILSSNNSSGNGTLRANGSSVGIITSEGVFRQFSLPGGAIPSDGSRFYFKISRVGSALTLRDLILEQDSSSVFTDTGTFTFSNFGRRNSQYFSGSLLNLQVVDGAVTTNNYDPTVSDHSPSTPDPLTLTDTIGGNDATGSDSMPKDGSAWIDLGGGLSRVFIDLTGPSRYLQSTQWIPASTFKISFKVAATSGGTSEYFDIGMFKLRIVNEQFIVLTPDDAGAGGTIGFTLASPLVIDDLNEFIITGDTGSTLVGLSVNGVAQTPTSTSTDTPNFSGGFIIGSTSAGSIAPETIIADFKVEDLTTPSNTYTWAIDQETANSEDAIEGGKILTYVGIPTGLPTRELFTYNSVGPVWDGNNGTTLTIAYPLPPTGIVIDVTENGPSFTESINANLSVNITGSITENGPAFTEVVTASLTSLTIQANISEVGPAFTESISVTLIESLIISADITEQGPSFTESITSSLGANIVLAITEQGPSFTESINISVVGDRVSSIVENGPSFVELIIASIPIVITINPKNIIRVKRKDNTVIVKRKSNIIRVR